ncbi:MAG: hypothetical protein HKO62_12855 [Gammaproteobacteria bacterium]|nr:hypothetical protein [Gammaproteobacteria bacterium]
MSAVATVALAALLVAAPLLLSPPGPGPAEGGFRTLADPGRNAAAGEHYLRVVFAGTLAETARRELLVGAGARVVDGPSPAGVYTIAPRAADADGAAGLLAALRTDPGVVFVEPAAGHQALRADGTPR